MKIVQIILGKIQTIKILDFSHNLLLLGLISTNLLKSNDIKTGKRKIINIPIPPHIKYKYISIGAPKYHSTLSKSDIIEKIKKIKPMDYMLTNYLLNTSYYIRIRIIV